LPLRLVACGGEGGRCTICPLPTSRYATVHTLQSHTRQPFTHRNNDAQMITILHCNHHMILHVSHSLQVSHTWHQANKNPINLCWTRKAADRIKVTIQHVAYPVFFLNKITSGFNSVTLWKTLYNCDSKPYQYTFIHTTWTTGIGSSGGNVTIRLQLLQYPKQWPRSQVHVSTASLRDARALKCAV